MNISGAATEPIRVAVSGARGRVGREIVAALATDPGFTCVAEVERDDNLEPVLRDSGAQVLVDFTTPQAGLRNALLAVEGGVAPVVGTTGLGEGGVARLRDAVERAGTGGCHAPNFAIGAALMMWMAALCAPHFDHVEIVETHAPAKADAPSGTALRTAERMLAARSGRAFARRDAEMTALAGTRGGAVGGIGIHSLRVEGAVADQDVVFGGLGQTLTLSHRTVARSAFAPGVLLAARTVVTTRRFYDSLEAVLGLVESRGGGGGAP